MVGNFKLRVTIIALACVGFLTMPDNASAISAELARKCSALTAKAFPPRVVGNPASGSAKGSGREERAYYRKCVANEGKVDKQTK
jgi:hypothetical protein